jgi:hypothetical protein
VPLLQAANQSVQDWWNAETIGDYWRLWNMPVSAQIGLMRTYQANLATSFQNFPFELPFRSAPALLPCCEFAAATPLKERIPAEVRC